MDLEEEMLKEFDQGGFIFNARRKRFEPALARRMIEKINSSGSDKETKTEVIRAIWRIPFFVLLYEDGCIKNGADAQAYRDVVVEVKNAVESKIDFVLGAS